MKAIHKQSTKPGIILMAIAVLVIVFNAITMTANADSDLPTSGERLITLHDNGKERGILTRASTLREAFAQQGIRVDKNDRVEPGLDEELTASSYDINIYRARPITIVDGAVRTKVLSPYRTPEQIAKSAGITLHDEDQTTLETASDHARFGTDVRLTVNRATKFTLILYGKKTTAYTREQTVGEMLKSKNITIGKKDTLSVKESDPMKKDMTISIWRNGKQTVTVDEKVPFETEKIEDADKPVGFREVKTPGVDGKKMVTYEIIMRNGKEVARKEIQSVVTKKAKAQVEVVGTKLELPAGSHEDWMRAAGIAAGDFGYVNAIFQQESGWTPSARNPAGYVGLGQTSEANLSGACPNWQSDPICQIRFFDGYKNRYGTWHDAYVFKFGEDGSSGHGWW